MWDICMFQQSRGGLINERPRKMLHGKGTCQNTQTDFVTTRPTQPRGQSWWKKLLVSFFCTPFSPMSGTPVFFRTLKLGSPFLLTSWNFSESGFWTLTQDVKRQPVRGQPRPNSILNWIELNWIELNWIELNWTELNWIELNWIELNLIELPKVLISLIAAAAWKVHIVEYGLDRSDGWDNARKTFVSTGWRTSHGHELDVS